MTPNNRSIDHLLDGMADLPVLVAITRIERLMGELLAEILHHPEFQALEALWTGVQLLVDSSPQASESDRLYGSRHTMEVAIWNVAKVELIDDLDEPSNVESSHFFRLVHDQHYNIAGGKPFSIIVGAYEFSHHPDDVELLRSIANVSAAAFSPFVAGLSPKLFRIDDFGSLYALARSFNRGDRVNALARLLDSDSYIMWNELRRTPNSRFVALALPRIQLRRPYDFRRHLGKFAVQDDIPFPFTEREFGATRETVLWGNAAFAFGAVVIDAFARSGWLADIHGVPNEPNRAGIVPHLQCDQFATDSPNVAPKWSTEVLITDSMEKQIADLGLLCLTHRHSTVHAAFCTTPSLHAPATFSAAIESASVKMTSLLQYTLCVCRFAHYLKMLGHELVGSAMSADEYETHLHEFLAKYTEMTDSATVKQKAEKPLREFKLNLRPVIGKPGHVHCDLMLVPHCELDAAEVHLTTEFSAQLTGP